MHGLPVIGNERFIKMCIRNFARKLPLFIGFRINQDITGINLPTKVDIKIDFRILNRWVVQVAFNCRAAGFFLLISEWGF